MFLPTPCQGLGQMLIFSKIPPSHPRRHEPCSQMEARRGKVAEQVAEQV